jgi:hypothetical protein
MPLTETLLVYGDVLWDGGGAGDDVDFTPGDAIAPCACVPNDASLDGDCPRTDGLDLKELRSSADLV